MKVKRNNGEKSPSGEQPKVGQVTLKQLVFYLG